MTIQLLDEIDMPIPRTWKEEQKLQKQEEKALKKAEKARRKAEKKAEKARKKELKKAAKQQAARLSQADDIINLEGQNTNITASLQADKGNDEQNVMMATASPATIILLTGALILLATAALFYRRKTPKIN